MSSGTMEKNFTRGEEYFAIEEDKEKVLVVAGTVNTTEVDGTFMCWLSSALINKYACETHLSTTIAGILEANNNFLTSVMEI